LMIRRLQKGNICRAPARGGGKAEQGGGGNYMENPRGKGDRRCLPNIGGGKSCPGILRIAGNEAGRGSREEREQLRTGGNIVLHSEGKGSVRSEAGAYKLNLLKRNKEEAADGAAFSQLYRAKGGDLRRRHGKGEIRRTKKSGGDQSLRPIDKGTNVGNARLRGYFL